MTGPVTLRPRNDPAAASPPASALAALGLVPGLAGGARSLGTHAEPRRLLDAEAGDGEDHLRLPGDAQGQDVSFTQSYGASTSQAKAVIAGPARPTSSSSRPATT